MFKADLKPNQIYKKETGYITLEILVSIVIALAFVAGTFQSLTYAMAIKVQAQEKQKANELIQEDIERMNQLGSNSALNGVCNPADYAGGYARALWDVLEPDDAPTPTKSLIKSIKEDGSDNARGKTLALDRFLFDDTTTNTPPYRTLRVGYRVWTWDGNDFKDKNGGDIDANDLPIAETFVEVIPDVALQCP